MYPESSLELNSWVSREIHEKYLEKELRVLIYSELGMGFQWLIVGYITKTGVQLRTQ